jgi:hypothetical protein
MTALNPSATDERTLERPVPDASLEGEADVSYFLHTVAYMASFCTVLIIVMLLCHLSFRRHFGLTLDVLPALKTLAVWLAAAHGVFALPRGMQRRLALRPHRMPVAVLAIFLLPLLAYVTGKVLFFFFPCIAALGIAGMARHADFTRRQWCILLVAALLYGLYFFIWVNGYYVNESGSTKMLDTYSLSSLKEAASLGNLYIDFYFGLSIIHMTQAWGHISSGLDGLVTVFPYHIGSYVWFAAVGRLNGTEPLTGVPLEQLILAFPMMLFMFMLAMLCVRQRLQSSCIFYLLVAVVVTRMAEILNGSNHFFYLSIPFNMALIVLFAAFPYLYNALNRFFIHRKVSFASCAALGACTVLLAICKAHVGLLYGAVAGFFVLRCYLSRRFLLGVCLPIAFIALIGARHILFSQPPHNESRDLTWVLELIPSMLMIYAPAIAGCTYLNAQYQKGISGFVAAPGKNFHHELFWIFFIIGTLPLVYPGGWNMLWFPRVVFWIFLLIVCTHPYCEKEFLGDCLRDWMRRFRMHNPGQARLTARQASIYLLLFFWALCFFGLMGSDYMRTSLYWHGNLSELDAYLHTNPTLLKRNIEQINDHAGGRDGLAVFVPAANTAFWSFGSNPDNRPFYIPAMAGIPMLMGLLPAGVPCVTDCSLAGNSFDFYAPDARAGNPSDTEICAHARRQHIARVFILNDAFRSEANRILQCI